MKRAHFAIALLSLACGLASAPAFAAILYMNGSAIGTASAENIGNNALTSDSFTLTSTSTVTGVEFVIWLTGGVNDSVTSVDYEIGTSAFGGQEEPAEGAFLTSAFDEVIDGGVYYVDTESFSISGLTLGPGTYYLTLAYAQDIFDEPTFWDIDNGSSTAYFDSTANSILSEDFEILGTPASVAPEPSSLLLMGTGLASLACMIRRKVKLRDLLTPRR